MNKGNGMRRAIKARKADRVGKASRRSLSAHAKEGSCLGKALQMEGMATRQKAPLAAVLGREVGN